MRAKQNPKISAKAVCSLKVAQEIAVLLCTKLVQLEETRNGTISKQNLVVKSVFLFQEILHIRTDLIHLTAFNAYVDECTKAVHLAPVCDTNIKQKLTIL